MSRAFALVSLLVGLGMFIGFGWLAVDCALDLRAFPQRPHGRTLAELAKTTHAPRGAWVRLVGPAEVAAGPVQPNSGGPHYVLLRSIESSAFVVVATELPGASAPFVGVPSVHRTTEHGPRYARLPTGLHFRAVPWARGPGQRVVILWTHSGPENSRLGVLMAPLFALLGLFVSFYAQRQLHRPALTKDVVWPEGELPKAVRLGPRAGARTRAHALILLGLGLAWLVVFGWMDFARGRLEPSSFVVLSVGAGLLGLGAGLWLLARRVSGHQYFADLVWLPVARTFAVKSEGFSTGVQAYEVERPLGAKPGALTVHSSPVHGGLVFRDAARSAVLAARPLHSTDLLVLSSTLQEIPENPLAPLAHPRHRVRPID